MDRPRSSHSDPEAKLLRAWRHHITRRRIISVSGPCTIRVDVRDGHHELEIVAPDDVQIRLLDRDE